MEKVTHFLGKTESGIFAQSLFGSSGCFEKVAGAPPFADWETGDRLREYLSRITKKDREQNVYVLVNALGAGEFYGSNINADYFPWDQISHEGEDFGYRTFLRAHAFQHHRNKDPERAFGVPKLSLVNPRMRRVELVIELNRDKARAEGADSILARIDAGEFPDVSMGCKVPFDVCSICSNKSKTRDDYCEHMRPPPELRHKYGPNRILDDGSKIYVVNIRPRYFDISFVFIGADRCAKTMAKLASKNGRNCMGNVCALPIERDVPTLYNARGDILDTGSLRKVAGVSSNGERGPCGRLCAECPDKPSCDTTKLAAAFTVKTSAQQKKAEILKRIPVSSFAVSSLPKIEKSEQPINETDLDSLSKHPLRTSLGATARAGIILKPEEFQRIVLKRMGEGDLAEKLDREHKVFREVPEIDKSVEVDLDSKLDELFQVLKAYIKERTALGTPFMLRVSILGNSAKKSLPTRTPIEDSLLDKVSAAYNGYRRDLLMKTAQAVEAVLSDSKLREELVGDGLANMFSKNASAPLVGLNSVAYLMSAHFHDRSLLSNSAGAEVASALNDEWILSEPA